MALTTAQNGVLYMASSFRTSLMGCCVIENEISEIYVNLWLLIDHDFGIKMVQYCCVPGCRTKATDPDSRFHHFPFRNKELVMKWESILSIQRTASKAMVVCARHFTPEDYRVYPDGYQCMRRPLRPNAVPSKNLPTASDIQKRKHRVMIEKLDQQKPITSVQMKRAKLKNVAIPSQKLPELLNQKILNKTSKQINLSSKPLKKPCTTKRPIITVVKAEDIGKVEEHNAERIEKKCEIVKTKVKEEANPTNKLLPVSDKNVQRISVSLNQEGKLLVTRDNKKKKRSSSVGSNSSNASNETCKSSASSPKRRKLDKPPPTVLGRQNDCYCWVCHKEGIILNCLTCPRAYHQKCAGEVELNNDWVCPECRRVIAAEEADNRSPALSDLSMEQFCALLKFSLNKLKYRAPAAFHQPVPLEYYSSYPEYVIHPMDLSLIEKNIKQKMYGCTESFLADVKWILHNSCVFNGTQHPLSANARSLVKTCEYDMGEIEVCPDCFLHACVRNKYWFSDICRKPHPLVWAKLKGFPYWPAKVVRIIDGNIDARFFGAHDRAWVPVSQCYHLSKEMPTSSKPKKKGTYETALDELNVHVHILLQRYGKFEYAPYRTPFDPDCKKYCYHGIDVNKTSQMEDLSFDPNNFNCKQSSLCANSATGALKLKKHVPDYETKEDTSDKLFPSSNVCDSPLTSQQSSDFVKECIETVKNKSVSEKKPPPSGVFEVSNEAKFEIPQNLELKSTTFDVKSLPNNHAENMKKLESALERIKEIMSDEVEIGCDEKISSEIIEDSKPDDNELQKAVIKYSEEQNNRIIDSKLPPDSEDSTTKSYNSENEDSKFAPNDDSKPVFPSISPSKKSDSFALKLDETIESCKAKLGITEISENQDSSSSESGDEEEEEEGERENEEESISSGEEMQIRHQGHSSDGDEGNKTDSSETDVDECNEENVPSVKTPTESEKIGSEESEVKLCEQEEVQKEIGVKEKLENSSESHLNCFLNCKKVNEFKDYECHTEDSEEKNLPQATNDHVFKENNLNFTSNRVTSIDNESGKVDDRSREGYQNNLNTPIVANVHSEVIKEEEKNLAQTMKGNAEETGTRKGKNYTEHYSSPSKKDNFDSVAINSTEMSDDTEKLKKEIQDIKKQLVSFKMQFEKQQWCHVQEIAELKHNMNLIIMEMRASLEADKKEALEEIRKQHNMEKLKAVDETKRKQWCANCRQEAMFLCCWNTSYCNHSCQKCHWPQHMHYCGQMKNTIQPSSALPANVLTSTDVANHSRKPKIEPSEVQEGSSNPEKKLILVNVKSTDLVSSGLVTQAITPAPSISQSQEITSGSEPQNQQAISKPQIHFITPKSQLQLITSTSSPNSAQTSQIQFLPNSPVQLLLTPLKPTNEQATLPSSSAAPKVIQDSAEIITKVRSRQTDLETAIKLLKEMNKETEATLKKEEKKNDDNVDLEEIYFPLPKMSIEDYCSSSIDAEEDDDEYMSFPEDDLLEDHLSLAGEAIPDEDQIMSEDDNEDDADEEMVPLTEGIEIKAKSLNRCLIYGTTPTRLTRHLMSVLFPDIKILANSCAFGHKSNVTKKTRPALPIKEVQTIIDYVQRRFPGAQRSEIVLAMNLKCKEARRSLSRMATSDRSKKIMLRKLAENVDSPGNQGQLVDNCSVKTLTPTYSAPNKLPTVASLLRAKHSRNASCSESLISESPLSTDTSSSNTITTRARRQHRSQDNTNRKKHQASSVAQTLQTDFSSSNNPASVIVNPKPCTVSSSFHPVPASALQGSQSTTCTLPVAPSGQSLVPSPDSKIRLEAEQGQITENMAKIVKYSGVKSPMSSASVIKSLHMVSSASPVFSVSPSTVIKPLQMLGSNQCLQTSALSNPVMTTAIMKPLQPPSGVNSSRPLLILGGPISALQLGSPNSSQNIRISGKVGLPPVPEIIDGAAEVRSHTGPS